MTLFSLIPSKVFKRRSVTGVTTPENCVYCCHIIQARSGWHLTLIQENLVSPHIGSHIADDCLPCCSIQSH
jgi:hypothetical protein